MQVNEAFHSIEKSRVIMIIIKQVAEIKRSDWFPTVRKHTAMMPIQFTEFRITPRLT